MEVDEERLVTRTGERHRAGCALHRLRGDLVVVRERALADVPRRDRRLVEDASLLTALLVDLLELVPLVDVEVLAVDRVDRARVVEERVAVLHLVEERPAVGPVGDGIAVVVDVDLVARVVGEPVEVRARRGQQQGNVVGDDDEAIRVGRADERVDVGVIDALVLRDHRSFAVAGGDGGDTGCGEGETGGGGGEDGLELHGA